MQAIFNKIRPSRASLRILMVGASLIFVAGSAACYSAPPYKPDTNTAVTQDPDATSQGVTIANTNDAAAAATVAETTLHTASDAAPPADTATLLADPNAMATINGNDFVPLVQAYAILYNNNAAAFYVTLQQVVDADLRGAILYAMNDTLNYHPVTLRDNAATADQETAQWMTYLQAVRTAINPQLYKAWAVPAMLSQTPALTAEAPESLPTVATLIPQTNAHDAVVSAITAAAPANTNGVDGNAFATLCATLVPMYQTSLIKYYQVLAQMPDKHLRDVVNFTITDAVANHPTILTQSDGGAATFATQSWPYYGKVGFAGSAQVATFTSIALDPNGPLQGKPYPMMP